MQEKCLQAKPGMPMLFLSILLYPLGIGLIVLGATLSDSYGAIGALPMVTGVLLIIGGSILFFGLKVIRPQEALVLTLFGTYIGTLKQAGFYFVNPFATAVNPAAGTRLGQSADVDSSSGSKLVSAGGNVVQTKEGSKKIS